MTKELISAIKEAEEQASFEKQTAVSRAETIVETAQQECAQLEKKTAEDCKSYKENAKKSADAAAQKEYEDKLAAQRRSAKDYCVAIVKDADLYASKIVGRIMRGDC